MKLPFGYKIIKARTEPEAVHVTVHLDKQVITRAIAREMNTQEARRVR